MPIPEIEFNQKTISTTGIVIIDLIVRSLKILKSVVFWGLSRKVQKKVFDFEI